MLLQNNIFPWLLFISPPPPRLKKNNGRPNITSKLKIEAILLSEKVMLNKKTYHCNINIHINQSAQNLKSKNLYYS